MLQYLTGKYCLEDHQTKKITDKDIFLFQYNIN